MRQRRQAEGGGQLGDNTMKVNDPWGLRKYNGYHDEAVLTTQKINELVYLFVDLYIPYNFKRYGNQKVSPRHCDLNWIFMVQSVTI